MISSPVSVMELCLRTQLNLFLGQLLCPKCSQIICLSVLTFSEGHH